MAATAYNVLEEQYELYAPRASAQPRRRGPMPSSSRRTLDHDDEDEDDGDEVGSAAAAAAAAPRRPTVSQSQKAVASLAGAIVTSVFMTPFDVIKTRLQVQANTGSARPPLSFDAHRLRPETSTAASASASARLPPAPPPSLRYQQQLTGLLDGVSKVWRAEGITGLWRGLSPTLVMTVPSQVTYMTCYDHLRTYFLALDAAHPSPAAALSRSALASAREERRKLPPGAGAVTMHSLLASLAAGAVARSISATLVTPLELVRTQMQATPSLRGHSSPGRGPASSSPSSLSGSSSPSRATSLSSIIRNLAHQTSQHGPRVLWRGLGSTLWRDVPFSAIYFAGYEALKRFLTGGGLGEGHASNHSAEFGISFVSGSVSGTVAAVLTQPADVVKTRLQTDMRGGSASRSGPSESRGAEAAARQSATPARTARTALTPSPASIARSPPTTLPAPPTTTFAVARDILQREGMQGLFKGLSPRVAKVAPACGVMIASFEVVGRLLASSE